MVVQDNGIEKNCCFYVSDFHLEMILVPYINKKIEKDISILTEKNLMETMETLLEKMNLNDENKQKILNLGWEGKENIEKNSNIIIIGSKEYIEQKNEKIKDLNAESVLDCYSFEETQNDMQDIAKNYKNTLNTLGNNNF